MTAQLQQALAEAKDKAEQDKAAKTYADLHAEEDPQQRARARGGEQQILSKLSDRQDAAGDRPRRRPQVGRGPAALLQRAG